MRVTTAQLPDAGHSDDRIFTAPGLVVMLDGASAFIKTAVTASDYVDHLGPSILAAIASDPAGTLMDALAVAIERTASDLDLVPGGAPSSTVAIAQVQPETVELLVLGDTQVVTPDQVIRDDRINTVATTERAAYQRRLREGHGYDDEHRALLAELQRNQRRHRNVQGGYWIAEAEPAAAKHALMHQLDPGDTPWLVFATDGAYRPMERLQLDDWPSLITAKPSSLMSLLSRCQRWESETDPDGLELSRAKRHDDKSLAVVTLQ